MKSLNEYLNPINEGYSWDAPSKNDMKTNIDKLIAFVDALNYLEYYEGRHSNDVLKWVTKEILGLSDKELKAAIFYNEFDVEDDIDEFIYHDNLEDNEGFEFNEIIDKFRNYLIKYKKIPEEIAEKIINVYGKDIQKELFDRDIIDEI